MIRLGGLLLVACAALPLGGCFMLLKVPEPYRVTYLLDPDTKRRSSSWENIAADIDAGAGVWGKELAGAYGVRGPDQLRPADDRDGGRRHPDALVHGAERARHLLA